MGIRIDILKRRVGWINPFPSTAEGYTKDSITGVITRDNPKKPGRYALRKNTKRARKFAAHQGGQV